MGKRILVISYYWIPCGGTATYRILKFVRELHNMGFEIQVLTAKYPYWHVKDANLENQVPEGIQVHRSFSFEPATLLGRKKKVVTTNHFINQPKTFKEKLVRWIRMNLFVPDAKIFWIPFAVTTGLKIIRKFRPDLILSTCPPPSTALVAQKLASKASIPWIADYRDPWTNIFYYDKTKQSNWAEKRNFAYERSALERADAITVVSKGFFPNSLPNTKKENVIPNGFDQNEELIVQDNQSKAKFVIRHLGTFKQNQYYPIFFECLNKACSLYPDLSVVFEFFGNVDNDVREQLEEFNFTFNLVFKGYQDRATSLKLLGSSDMLFMVIGNSALGKNVYSTKLFDYMRTKKPIIALGPMGGVADSLLSESGCGRMFDYEDKKNIANHIRECLDSWLVGNQNNDPKDHIIESYSFGELTKRLVSLINEVTDDR